MASLESCNQSSLNFLKSTINHGITYKKSGVLLGYADSDWSQIKLIGGLYQATCLCMAADQSRGNVRRSQLLHCLLLKQKILLII